MVEAQSPDYCQRCEHFQKLPGVQYGYCRLSGKVMVVDRFGMPRAACPLGKDRSLVQEEELSVVITWYLREDDLEQSVASVKKHLPGAELIVQNTQGNLSWGRNQGVKKATRPYVLIMEEDMQLVDKSVLKCLEVLKRDERVGACAGICLEPEGTHHYLGTIIEKHDEVAMLPWTGRWRTTITGVPYAYTDTCLNFMVCRRQMLEEIPWNEGLPLMEHLPWLYEVRKSRWLLAVCPLAWCAHRSEYRGMKYRQARGRRFNREQEAAIGKRLYFGNTKTYSKPNLPNIVVLTPGGCNSTVFVKILGALGWKVPDQDPWCEPPHIRQLDQEMLCGRRVPVQALYHALRILEKPWVVKEPRMCEVFEHWYGPMMAEEATLIMLTKDRDRVLENFQRQWGMDPKFAEDLYQRRMERCWFWYERYLGPKWHIHADQMEEAAELFDPQRSRFGPLGHRQTCGIMENEDAPRTGGQGNASASHPATAPGNSHPRGSAAGA